MTFEEAVAHVLKFEGEYSNDPNDPGGETKFGISKKAYPRINIQALTVETAKALYRKDYWNAVKIDRLPPSLRLMVFDAAVNQGPMPAVTMLQKLVGATPDGAIGPATLTAIDQIPEKDLLLAYAKARMSRYRVTKGFELYGSGWLGRLMDVTIESSTHLGKIIT